MSPVRTIVTIAQSPGLVPVVTDWVWNAFWRHNGYAPEDTRRVIAGAVAQSGPPQCFVLLLDGRPVGTASLMAQDLESRPDLTPWLAGVFVEPDARRQGCAANLVRAVEDAARTAAIPALWLYTTSAERLYARLGWHGVSRFDHHGQDAALMRRELG